MKKFAINMLLAGASLLFALAVGEVTARIYLSYRDGAVRAKNQENILTQVDKKELFTPIHPGSFTNRSNATTRWWGYDIRTDSLGCRIGPPAPEQARTILFIGDSMIFGLGLPDSAAIPALLQARLNSAVPDRPCRVVNAGVIGYDFQQYLYRLRALTPAVKPDLIIVGLCYNDLLPNEDPFGDVMADRQEEAESQTAHEASIPVAPHRSLLSGIKASLQSSALYTVWSQSGLSSRSAKQRLSEFEPAKLASAQQAPALVADFRRTANQFGVPVAYVYFPVYAALHQDSDLIYVRLLRETGQPVLDLSHIPGLNRESYFLRENRGHLLPDIHFNLRGSQQVADEISRWLVEKGLW